MKQTLTRIDFNNGHLWINKLIIPQTGDVCYDPHSKSWGINGNSFNPDNLKIIAQTNLNLPNIPHVEVSGEDVELLFIEKYGVPLNDNANRRLEGFQEGYKANKGKYSEEDLRKAFKAGIKAVYNPNKYPDEDEYIKSLNKIPDEIQIKVQESCTAESAEPCLCLEKFGYTREKCKKPITYTKEGKTFLILQSK